MKFQILIASSLKLSEAKSRLFGATSFKLDSLVHLCDILGVPLWLIETHDFTTKSLKVQHEGTLRTNFRVKQPTSLLSI